MELISSLQNGRIKECVKLRDRRQRDRSGLFLIEGYRELFRAAGKPLKTLFICPSLFLGSNEGDLISRVVNSGVEVVECSEAVFRKISYRDRPDGLLATAPHLDMGFDHLPSKDPAFFVVAESIEKPGNLGTILRSSDAVGVDGLIVCDKCTDIHNPNVVRASVGTLFTVPIADASTEDTLSWLRSRGISVLAATPSAEKEYTDVDMTGPVAVVVGTEQYGLSEKWMKAADIQVRIPMLGVADSLNAAMATTILLYEVLRQRR